MSGFVHVKGDAQPIRGRDRLRRLARDRRQCVGPLRHLDEGHRHRRQRLGRPHVGLHGAGRHARRARRRRRGLGDSIYEARLFVRGTVKSLGADCIEKEMRDRAPSANCARLLDRRRGRRARSMSPSSSATARRASSTISTSTTPAPTDAARNDRQIRTPPRHSATFDRRTRSPRFGAPPRPASTTSAAAAPSARCRISTICCFSAPRLAAIRSKAIARNARPTSCSARASPRSRSN